MGCNISLGDVVEICDSLREPLSARQRETRAGIYPYYGAQGIVDYLDDYSYEGEYLLVAEDGENLRSRKQPIANMVAGKFRVNNHAHVVQGTSKARLQYIYYILNMLDISPYVTGSTQPKLSQKSLSQIEIELPSIEQQDTILALIVPLDKKISLNNQINDYLLKVMRTNFKRLFSHQAKTTGSIYDIAEVIYGAAFRSSLFNEEREGFPLIRIRDLTTFDPQVYTTEAHPKKTVINPGDVVAGMDAEFTPTFWLGSPALLNQRVCHFAPPQDSEVTPSYLLFALEPLLQFIQNYATGTTVAHLGKSDLEALEVGVPSYDSLKQFAIIAEPMRWQIVQNSIENRSLSELRDALLSKLMSGKIDVSKVDITQLNNHLSDC